MPQSGIFYDKVISQTLLESILGDTGAENTHCSFKLHKHLYILKLGFPAGILTFATLSTSIIIDQLMFDPINNTECFLTSYQTFGLFLYPKFL